MAFKDCSMKARVHNILIVIPDYVTFLSPCIDKEIGQMHRLGQTQHQWKFEAVEKNSFFPFGCKTTFRAYSSDKVVEFKVFNFY